MEYDFLSEEEFLSDRERMALAAEMNDRDEDRTSDEGEASKKSKYF